MKKIKCTNNNIKTVTDKYQISGFSFSDYTGIAASFLCFIHCWVLPVIILFIPGLITHNGWVHLVLGSIAIVCTIPVLVEKSHKNHDKRFLLRLMIGNSMLIIILLSHDYLSLLNEILISTTGGLCLISVHYEHLKLKNRSCKHLI